MEAPAFSVLVRSKRLRSLRAALVLISPGIGALIFSLYFWTQFQRVPAINWFIAVCGCLATLGLAVALTKARSPLRQAWPAVALAVACTAVGFLWGPLGIFCLIVAGNVGTKLIIQLRGYAKKP